jgi:hypothetical protein
MAQTEVATTPDLGLEGQLATAFSAGKGDVVARTSDEASASLPFGKMVMIGATDETVHNIAANTSILDGIIVHAHGYHRDLELDDDGLRPGCTFDVLRVGAIIVRSEDAFGPSTGVHVRAVVAGDEIKGSFRGADDGTDTIDCSAFCRWLTSGDAGELGVLDINMTMAALQAADS